MHSALFPYPPFPEEEEEEEEEEGRQEIEWRQGRDTTLRDDGMAGV